MTALAHSLVHAGGGKAEEAWETDDCMRIEEVLEAEDCAGAEEKILEVEEKNNEEILETEEAGAEEALETEDCAEEESGGQKCAETASSKMGVVLSGGGSSVTRMRTKRTVGHRAVSPIVKDNSLEKT